MEEAGKHQQRRGGGTQTERGETSVEERQEQETCRESRRRARRRRRRWRRRRRRRRSAAPLNRYTICRLRCYCSCHKRRDANRHQPRQRCRQTRHRHPPPPPPTGSGVMSATGRVISPPVAELGPHHHPFPFLSGPPACVPIMSLPTPPTLTDTATSPGPVLDLSMQMEEEEDEEEEGRRRGEEGGDPQDPHDQEEEVEEEEEEEEEEETVGEARMKVSFVEDLPHSPVNLVIVRSPDRPLSDSGSGGYPEHSDLDMEKDAAKDRQEEEEKEGGGGRQCLNPSEDFQGPISSTLGDSENLSLRSEQQEVL